MMFHLISIALIFAASLLSAANGQQISISTVADSTQIGAWLHSADPRLVAWGAYFANKQDDAAGLALLPHMMEQWVPPANHSGTDERPNHDEMIAVID